MLVPQKSKNHHWWPVGLQSYWTDTMGDLCWIEPDGKVDSKRAANRKVGYKIHGHTFLKGSVWETNFENEFGIDNHVHAIVEGLRKLRPLGRTPTEFFGMMKLIFKKNKTLRDMCKFYHMDAQLHRQALLLLHSILIRSPMGRNRYENYPELVGLPRNEEVGKANMRQTYQAAKNLCERGLISNQYFVLLHSPFKKFIFGDGCLDWLTSGLTGNRISGRALVPLTPHLCVYFCTPTYMRSAPNCASLSVAPWVVDWVNGITQIYARDKLFFLGKPPILSEPFRRRQFFVHGKRTDALIDMLDQIAGIKREHGWIATTAFQ